MKESDWPKLTQQPLNNVDATPDQMYPIRILKSFRENCNCKWATGANGECDNPLFKLMNEHADQRAIILDKAIAILEREMRK